LIVDENRQRISLMSIVREIVLGMIGESWGLSGLMVVEVTGARRSWDKGCQGDVYKKCRRPIVMADRWSKSRTRMSVILINDVEGTTGHPIG